MSVYTNNTYNKDKPNDAWFKIFQFIKPGTNILDIGCSSGKLGAALKKEKQVHIIGVDIDEADVKLAKQQLDDARILNIEQDDPAYLGKFDYIIMADVIEHLIDPATALKKVAKLLKKEGKLIFSIPNMANVTTRLELLRGRFEYKDFGLLDRTHLHFYDHHEVNRVFNAAGFEVETTDCTLRNIPDTILLKELKKLGINELTPTLRQHLNSEDALVYQFIGVAKPGKTPKKLPILTKTPLDIISVEMENLKKAQKAEVKDIVEKNKWLNDEVNRLDTELSAILNSKGWRMLKKVHTVKHVLKRKK